MTERLTAIFFNRRVAVLAMIGFASGLPLALTGGTFQGWMKDQGLDLATIGLFQLVTLPYVLKFAWAPLMDRYVPPFLGRRRGWLLVTQLLLVGAIVLLALRGGGAETSALFALALLVAVLSASQDIVADAYRTDILAPDERGIGAAWFVAGYRIAMLASGAGAFILVGRGLATWPTAYLLLACAMIIGVVATLIAPEPHAAAAPPGSLFDAIVPPWRELVARPGGWSVLAFVLLFRLPDTIAGTMTVPFLRDIDVSNTQIGVIRNGFGVGMTIVGAMAGGIMVSRAGLRRSLWIAGILQAVSNAGFWALAQTGNHTPTLLIVMFIENFCGGLAVAAFFAFLMSQCSANYSATQYALLSSLMALAGTLVGSQTGKWAANWGWNVFFANSVIAALPGLLLLWWMQSSTTGRMQAMLKALLISCVVGMGALGCSHATRQTFDVSVRNDLDHPITVWLTKDGPPFEPTWASPEELATERPGGSDQYLGVVVPPSKTGSTGSVDAMLDPGTCAWLRIYGGGEQFSELLALSRGNPRRLDLPLQPGKNHFIVSDKSGRLTADRVDGQP